VQTKDDSAKCGVADQFYSRLHKEYVLFGESLDQPSSASVASENNRRVFTVLQAGHLKWVIEMAIVDMARACGSNGCHGRPCSCDRTVYRDVDPVYALQVARMKREHLARQNTSIRDNAARCASATTAFKNETTTRKSN
jgi:hypothetical protein